MKNPLIAKYAAMSDFGKQFVADFLAVHASDELLAQAIQYGQAADTLPNRNAVRNGDSLLPLVPLECKPITGGEYFRFLHPNAPEEPESYD